MRKASVGSFNVPRAAVVDDVRDHLGHTQIEARQRLGGYAPRSARLAEPGRGMRDLAGINSNRKIHNRIDGAPGRRGRR